MSKPNRPNLPQLVHTARSTMSERLNGYLQQAGVSLSQWRVLALFDQATDIDLETLKHRAGNLASTLSPALDALEKAGLIEYRPDQGDRRVYLTARGHFLLQRLNPKIAFLYSQIERQQHHPALKSAYRTLAQLIRPKNK